MKTNWLTATEKAKVQAKNLLSYLGLFVAAATVFVFSALFFTELRFSVESLVSLSLSFLLLFVSSYIMYVSLFETGKTEGKKEECYTTLSQKRGELFERFRREGSQASLADFCKEVSRKETEAARNAILDAHFMSEEDVRLCEQKPPEARTKREKRALRALSRQEAVVITPRALLAERPSAARHAPLSLPPEKSRLRRTLAFLIPLALFSIVSVSVVCEVIADPSLDAVIGYLLKLFTLLHSGIKGFRAGFFHVTADTCDYIKEQSELLTEYFDREEVKKTAAEAAAAL